ncbi:MAG: twin-arginine translocase TatA/TatE family subunit [bacterium]
MGVGGPEVLVILLVALLVFGPKSIPDVARTLAKAMRELRKLSTEFQREMNMLDLDRDEPRTIRPPGPPKTAGEPGTLPTETSPPVEAAPAAAGASPAAPSAAAPSSSAPASSTAIASASPDAAAGDATKPSAPSAG